MRKRGRESRTAVCSSIGILTSPKASEPFQSARAIKNAPCKSQTAFVPFLCGATAFFQLAFGFEPVIEVAPIRTAALQVAVIRGFGNLIVGRAVAGSLSCVQDRHVSSGVNGVCL